MTTLKEQLAKIPQGTEYQANRYDTEDEHVLHLWNTKEGRSYDLRVKKE
jgi:hypothetical protein